MQPHKPRLAEIHGFFFYFLLELFPDLLEDLEFFKRNGIGVINASPLALGLLNNEVNVPRWHVVNSLAPTMIKRACQKAALKCIEMNANLGE